MKFFPSRQLQPCAPRHPRRKTSRRTLGQAQLLAIGILLALFSLIALDLGITRAQGDRDQREAAFAAKADKVLKLVRQAVSEDRAAAVRGGIHHRSAVDDLSNTAAIERRPGGRVAIDVAVALDSDDQAELVAAGFAVASHVGPIATLETEVDRLPDLASLSSVRKIFASGFRHPLNDRARQAVGIENSSGQRMVSQTGRGIVVGIIDTGIDFRHLDFTVPGSAGHQTRIKAMLDMTVYGAQAPDPNWNYTLPGQAAVIGHIYSEADINSALQIPKPSDQNADAIKERDKNGHGSHVAGTAAGNGLSSPTPGTYAGMAPEADLIIVKASRQNDGNDDFRTTDVINAMEFIRQKAAELGEPFVINLSLGGQAGPHDGTNPDERAVDAMVNAGPGRAVCVAAGNEGDSNRHARGTVTAGGSQTLDININGAADFIDLYQSNSDRFSVTVTRPDGTILGPVSYDPNGFSQKNGQASDQYLQIFNSNDDKGDADPSNDQPDIFILFKTGVPQGLWKVTLQDADSNPNQSFDAWATGNLSFSNLVDNDSRLISSPGSAREAITVGAFITRSASLSLGFAAPFTSPGPTADGRQKPEISAPGYYLYSSRSSDVADSSFGTIGTGPNAPVDAAHYTGLAGTSMSTPVVAGAVALFLESNAALTSAQIKDSIRSTATQDSYTDPTTGWNPRLGTGKLNIAAAIQLGGRPVYTISGHVNPTLGQVTLTLSGSKSTFTSPDSSGNYRFKNLIAGGNYTVTPSIVTGPYEYSFAPSSYTFSNLSANQSADFVAIQLTHNISGRITNPAGNGVAGIEVRPNFSSTTPVLSDGNGNYLLANLPNGVSYDVLVSSSNYVLTPNHKFLGVLTKDETVNFIARRFYGISGKVSDQSGSPLSGVSVISTGPSLQNAMTDASGNYHLNNLVEGSDYQVALSASGYVFNPNGTVIVGIDGNKTLDFVGHAASSTYAIYGLIRDGNGKNVEGVRVQLRGALSATMLTNANGLYRFDRNEPGGNYTVTPTVNGLPVTPASKSITNLSADTGLDFSVVQNAIDDPGTFVTQQYRDFLNREPDTSGLDFWTKQVTSCFDNIPCIERKRVNVSAAFFLSIEFQETGYLVERIYKAAYGDAMGSSSFGGVHQLSVPVVRRAEFTPDTQQIGQNVIVGRTGWETVLENNKQTFTTAFTQRPAFVAVFPASMTPPQFVDKLNDNAGHPLAQSERDQLVNDLTTNAKTRAQVLRAVAEDPDLSTAEFNRAFVLMQYFGYLRRNPNDTPDSDYTGFDFWLTKLNQFNGSFVNADMVKAFIGSGEYRKRFGP